MLGVIDVSEKGVVVEKEKERSQLFLRRRRYPTKVSKPIIIDYPSNFHFELQTHYLSHTPSTTMMLHPQMSPDYSVENEEDFRKMAAGTVAPVSSVQGNGVNTEIQREPLARSPVTPPPSGPVQRTGRWTPDEKILFLYGLKRFGKGRWKKMSIYLPHRSLVQIKSHAQKVLKRLQAGENVFRRLEENYNIIEPLIAQAAQEHDVLAQFDDQGLVVNNSGRRPAKKNFFEEAPLSYSQLFGTQPPAPVATKPAPQQDGDVAALAASALCQLSSLPK